MSYSDVLVKNLNAVTFRLAKPKIRRQFAVMLPFTVYRTNIHSGAAALTPVSPSRRRQADRLFGAVFMEIDDLRSEKIEAHRYVEK